MKIIKEFKEFAVKGNMIDMAVGIVIGAAFSTVVKSLVDDIITPVIGRLTGGVDFSNLFIVLNGGGRFDTLQAARDAGAVTLNYGLFVNSIITFLIVSWALFMVIKATNRIKRESSLPPTPTEKECPQCLSKVPLKATKCAYCTSQLS